MQKIESSVKSARDIVMEYIQATERQDFQSARGYLRDNMTYVSPVNSFDRAEPYLKYNLHLYETGQLVKFDIKKEFADSNDVCILHELNSQLVCVWYHVDDDGKISSIKVIFDPRPFAAGAKQK
ncbi:MAG: nuclear transport factor 2 family protein [Nitrososphaeraceae archaeon]